MQTLSLNSYLCGRNLASELAGGNHTVDKDGMCAIGICREQVGKCCAKCDTRQMWANGVCTETRCVKCESHWLPVYLLRSLLLLYLICLQSCVRSGFTQVIIFITIITIAYFHLFLCKCIVLGNIHVHRPYPPSNIITLLLSKCLVVVTQYSHLVISLSFLASQTV